MRYGLVLRWIVARETGRATAEMVLRKTLRNRTLALIVNLFRTVDRG